jgi:hypothetical protein
LAYALDAVAETRPAATGGQARLAATNIRSVRERLWPADRPAHDAYGVTNEWYAALSFAFSDGLTVIPGLPYRGSGSEPDR